MIVSDRVLVNIAKAASTRAYAPYSGFPVGAALLTATGEVFTGCNLENASFGLTICAERVAVGNAVAAGLRSFSRLALVADCSPPPVPCGACRQVFCELAPQLEIIAGNLQGEVVCYRLPELLPEPFIGNGFPKATPAPFPRVETWRLPLTVRPIGYVSNSYSEPKAVPKDYKQQVSKIIIDNDFVDGLYRIEEEKKIIIIGHLHRVEEYSLIQRRRGRGEEYGVFVCRSPRRPNFISHTPVDLISREGPVLTVRGLDLINETPVLDIKTVYPPVEC